MKNFWLTQAEKKKKLEKSSIEMLFQQMIRERYQHIWHFSKFQHSKEKDFWMSVKLISKTPL